MWKQIGIGILATLAVAAGLMLVSEIALRSKQFWKPRWQNVETQTFKATKAYNESKQQMLANYFQQYQQGDLAEKDTIRAVIQVQFADYDANQIANYALRQFLHQTRGF